MQLYRIGEIAKLSGLSLRTIRYYEEEGLIKSKRSSGGQRYYTNEDLVYLKRVIELKGLGFSLSEIREIFRLKAEDESGNRRREELLKRYKAKMEEDKKKLSVISHHMAELEWRIHQLEKAEDGFTSCPGSLCAGCEYKTKCVFFRSDLV